MALETTTKINVDFHDKKYIMINAKQYDHNSRWIAVTCYDDGNLFNLSASKHTAYIRYRKADGYGVLNTCRINYKGEVLVELTEQMLSAVGICYVDLIIVNRGSAIVNIETGEIITTDGSAIISTMAFCINVCEAAVDNSLIESSYEYEVNALNDLLQKANSEYKEVIQLARSYAIGDADDVRENEDYDNSKYYSLLSKSYAIGDLDGSTETKDRENEGVDNAEYYSRLAKSYAKGDLSGSTGTRSEEGIDNAQYYSQMSKSFAMGGTGLEARSGEDVDNSEYYSQMSKSYAMGGTGLEARDGEDIDNAEYYSRLSKSYAKGGTNIAERNVDGEDENIDNAEYYSRLAKSYTMGSFDGSTGTRSDESTENAKTYMETTKSHMDTTDGFMKTTEEYMETTEGYMNTTDGFMDKAEEYMNTTNGYMGTTEGYMNKTEEYMNITDGYMKTTDGYMKTTESYMNATEGYMNKTEGFMNTTDGYMSATKGYMETAQGYMDTAESHMNNAETYMNNAATSETNAKTSETNAATSETNAYDYSIIAQRYAIGGTGTVSGEDTDNARYYYQQVKGIQDSLSGTLSPQGTISFGELATAEKFTGYMYLIDESFTTDETFADGGGVQYPAGTLVYYTADGYWACLDTFGSSVATADEVKEYLGLLM